MNPRALFRDDIESFFRESIQLLLLHCIDRTYSGIFIFLCLSHFFGPFWSMCTLANGYGFIFASVLAALRGYTGPTEASGFELDRHLSYCYVTVRPPSGGFFSSVSVETPFMTYTDHFKRVSI